MKAKRSSVSVQEHIQDLTQLYCNAVEIEQVLINLLNNAIDAASESAEKWVEIQASQSDEHIIVRVIDSGKGISVEQEKNIFQPFFTTKPVGEGTGLGLSISIGILKDHNAVLELNKTFKNTCFEIRFPIILGGQETAPDSIVA